jgi:hypothetical protein
MPSSLAMSMDVRKWSWPGALTFGKGAEQKKPAPEPEQGGIKPTDSPSTTTDVDRAEHKSTPDQGGIKANLSITRSPSTMTEVDRGALEDAISSNGVRGLLEKASDGLSSADDDAAREGSLEADHDADTPRPSRVPSPLPDEPSNSSGDPDGPDKLDRGRQLDFACTFVFLAGSGDPLETHRRQVIHLRVSIMSHSSVVFTLPC